jgi:Formate/nitrite transporter
MVSTKAVVVVCAAAACRAAAFAPARAGLGLAASKLAAPRCCTAHAAGSLRMVATATAPLMPPPTVYQPAAKPAEAAATAAATPAALMAPPAMYQNAVKLGEAKAAMPVSKILTLGILSGCHIAFGALLAISVGGTCSNMAATNPGAQKFLLGAGTTRPLLLHLHAMFQCCTHSRRACCLCCLQKCTMCICVYEQALTLRSAANIMLFHQQQQSVCHSACS